MSLDMHAPLLPREAETGETNGDCIIPVNEQQTWPKRFICKIPPWITELNHKSHKPQVVSFGPYHHGKDKLPLMEEHKLRALNRFVEQSGKSRESFLESLRGVVGDLKESYGDLEWQEDTEDEFLELMLRDGCFMIEIMRTEKGDERGYAHDDPIFSNHRLNYIKPYIRRDMLILENQLPMLVLYRLAAVENNGKEDFIPTMQHHECINKLILEFYFVKIRELGRQHALDAEIRKLGRRLHVVDIFREGQLMELQQIQPKMENCILKLCDTCKRGTGGCLLHVMGVFRKCCSSEKDQHEETKEIIRSATELQETGIRFKKSDTHSLKDISFDRGVLKLPRIKVEDATESMFLNLMTFERLHNGAGNEVTAYVTFMDNIINDEQDVALLHTEGIIQNAIGSNKAVAELFNSLCKEVPLACNINLDTVHKDINKHCKNDWYTWRAHLHRNYFKSPWTSMSLIAAILLFVLTIVQTYYAVISYY